MSGNFAIKGGGVGRLMANAILNFHFDFLTPSLIDFYDVPSFCACYTIIIIHLNWNEYYVELFRRSQTQTCA